MPGARYHLLKMFRGPRFAKCATNAGYALPLSMAFISICFFIPNHYKRGLSESDAIGGGVITLLGLITPGLCLIVQLMP